MGKRADKKRADAGFAQTALRKGRSSVWKRNAKQRRKRNNPHQPDARNCFFSGRRLRDTNNGVLDCAIKAAIQCPTNPVVEAAFTMEPPATSSRDTHISQFRKYADKYALNVDSEERLAVGRVIVSN